MILFEICGRSEAHPLYQWFEAKNGVRHYDFLQSLVEANVAAQRAFLSSHIIKALNFHAITCLHTNAGEYRPCPVFVGDPEDKVNCYIPPQHFEVQAQMDDLVNTVNRAWMETDDLTLASFVLWKLNHIHPFINGNGRTARAACYFVICLKLGSWLPGRTILPELLRQNRVEYVAILKAVDATYKAGSLDLSPLRALLERLLLEQVSSAAPADSAGAAAAPPRPAIPLLQQSDGAFAPDEQRQAGTE
jgi:Fic family protein